MVLSMQPLDSPSHAKGRTYRRSVVGTRWFWKEADAHFVCVVYNHAAVKYEDGFYEQRATYEKRRFGYRVTFAQLYYDD